MLINEKHLRRIGDAAAKVAREAATAALAELTQRIAALEAGAGQPVVAAPDAGLAARVQRLERIEAAARTAGSS